MLVWLSAWSEMQTCIWLTSCHCHSLSLALVKSKLDLPCWYRLIRVIPEKGPLNGCVCVCVCVCKTYFVSHMRTDWLWTFDRLPKCNQIRKTNKDFSPKPGNFVFLSKMYEKNLLKTLSPFLLNSAEDNLSSCVWDSAYADHCYIYLYLLTCVFIYLLILVPQLFCVTSVLSASTGHVVDRHICGHVIH